MLRAESNRCDGRRCDGRRCGGGRCDGGRCGDNHYDTGTDDLCPCLLQVYVEHMKRKQPDRPRKLLLARVGRENPRFTKCFHGWGRYKAPVE